MSNSTQCSNTRVRGLKATPCFSPGLSNLVGVCCAPALALLETYHSPKPSKSNWHLSLSFPAPLGSSLVGHRAKPLEPPIEIRHYGGQAVSKLGANRDRIPRRELVQQDNHLANERVDIDGLALRGVASVERPHALDDLRGTHHLVDHVRRSVARLADVGRRTSKPARQAGRHVAIPAATATPSTAPACVAGSSGATPNTIALSCRCAITVRSSPPAAPPASNQAPCAASSHTARRGSAPKAMRMPISRLRVVTASATRPYRPITASMTAASPNAEMRLVCSRVSSSVASRLSPSVWRPNSARVGSSRLTVARIAPTRARGSPPVRTTYSGSGHSPGPRHE